MIESITTLLVITEIQKKLFRIFQSNGTILSIFRFPSHRRRFRQIPTQEQSGSFLRNRHSRCKGTYIVYLLSITIYGLSKLVEMAYFYLPRTYNTCLPKQPQSKPPTKKSAVPTSTTNHTFFTLTPQKGYVISYLQVSATIDITGDVEFNLVQGDTGSKRMVFQLITNQTDFLTYNYLVYGIKEAEYKKVTIKS